MQPLEIKAMKKILFASILTFTVINCGSMKNSQDSTKVEEKESTQSILHTSWSLISDRPESTHPTLVIEPHNVSGNGGCNNFTGFLELDESTKSFKASKVANTRMMCKGTNEESYLRMLQEVTSYKIKSGKLYLYKGNLLLMSFNKL